MSRTHGKQQPEDNWPGQGLRQTSLHFSVIKCKANLSFPICAEQLQHSGVAWHCRPQVQEIVGKPEPVPHPGLWQAGLDHC